MREYDALVDAKNALRTLEAKYGVQCTFYATRNPLMMVVEPREPEQTQLTIEENESVNDKDQWKVTLICDMEQGVLIEVDRCFRSSYADITQFKKTFNKICLAWRELAFAKLVERSVLTLDDMEVIWIGAG